MKSKHPGAKLTPWTQLGKSAADTSDDSDSESAADSASGEDPLPDPVDASPVENGLTAMASIQCVARLHVKDETIMEAMELTGDWLGEKVVAVQETECVWGTLVDTQVGEKFPDWPHFRIHVDPVCAALWKQVRRSDNPTRSGGR